jgi:hypothetical protein
MQRLAVLCVLLLANLPAFAVKQASTKLAGGQNGDLITILTQNRGRNVGKQWSQLGLYKPITVNNNGALYIKNLDLANSTPPSKGTLITLKENVNSASEALSESANFNIVEVNATYAVMAGSCEVKVNIEGDKPTACTSSGGNPDVTCKVKCHSVSGTSCPTESQIDSSGFTYWLTSEVATGIGSVSVGNTRCCYLELYDTHCNTATPGNQCGGNPDNYIVKNTTYIEGVRATGTMMSPVCTVINSRGGERSN